uniref:Uncharacterized protein n=1 Tax=Magallana gigas TaxID=29159 RepID=K1Q6U5_MAGGI
MVDTLLAEYEWEFYTLSAGADTGFVVRGAWIKLLRQGVWGPPWVQGAKPPEAPGFSCILKPILGRSPKFRALGEFDAATIMK